MALTETALVQSNKLPLSPRSQPTILETPAAAKEAGSTGDQKHLVKGQPATPHFDFYRPRFLVLPTGRTIFAWGIWDTQKNPFGSIPTCLFKMSDFVKRFKAANLGKAYAFARKLNERHEQKVAA